MRLMCPNCDAEYEVDASAIPESGRDVQCSNCGHAWFQQHPELEADGDAVAALYDPPPPLSKTAAAKPILPSNLDWQVESDDPEAILDAMGRDAREDGANRPRSSVDAPPEGGSSADAPTDTPGPVPKHDIDPEALRILREEVERETAQRALEQGRVDPVTDQVTDQVTGQIVGPAVAPVVARRVARLKGIQPPLPNPLANPQPVAASARLPKIETVSAALRSQNDPPAKPIRKPKTNRGGLFLSLFLGLVAASLYAFSPDLAVIFPSFAKYLAQYVTIVDGLRSQVDVLLSQGIALSERLIGIAKGWL